MIQAGRDLKRDRAYGKEGRGLWKNSSIGEKIGSKVLAWGGAWLWKELLEGLCGKWNPVTSQHNLEGEGGLRGILEGRYMLEQKSGGLEPSLKEEGKEPRMMKGNVWFERDVVSGGVRLRSLQGKWKDGRVF